MNDTITYICDHGYRLNGTAQRTCLPGGQWSGTAASCQGKAQENVFPTQCTNMLLFILVVFVMLS